jgi:hypothetical protein
MGAERRIGRYLYTRGAGEDRSEMTGTRTHTHY